MTICFAARAPALGPSSPCCSGAATRAGGSESKLGLHFEVGHRAPGTASFSRSAAAACFILTRTTSSCVFLYAFCPVCSQPEGSIHMPITNREATFFPYRVPPIAVYILLFLFSVLIFALCGLDLPLHRDNGIYVYSGQRLLLGEIPYQSVFDGKMPMTPFVTAFALYISQPFFDDPLRGMRVVYMIIGIITILLSYPLAQKLFKDKFAAILAPLMMIGLHGYMFQAAIGARPKQLLLIFFYSLSPALSFFWTRGGCCWGSLPPCAPSPGSPPASCS